MERALNEPLISTVALSIKQKRSVDFEKIAKWKPMPPKKQLKI